MCVYIYIYIHTYIYIYIYIYMRVGVCVCVCAGVYIYICIYGGIVYVHRYCVFNAARMTRVVCRRPLAPGSFRIKLEVQGLGFRVIYTQALQTLVHIAYPRKVGNQVARRRP